MKLSKFFLASLILLIALFFRSDPASAVSTYLTTWKNTYTGSQSGNNASCNLCHSSGGGTDLNGYGKDFATAMSTATSIVNALRAIEALNSDGDPTAGNNLAEINASAQPGWTPGRTTRFTIYSIGRRRSRIRIRRRSRATSSTRRVRRTTRRCSARSATRRSTKGSSCNSRSRRPTRTAMRSRSRDRVCRPARR